MAFARYEDLHGIPLPVPETPEDTAEPAAPPSAESPPDPLAAPTTSLGKALAKKVGKAKRDKAKEFGRDRQVIASDLVAAAVKYAKTPKGGKRPLYNGKVVLSLVAFCREHFEEVEKAILECKAQRQPLDSLGVEFSKRGLVALSKPIRPKRGRPPKNSAPQAAPVEKGYRPYTGNEISSKMSEIRLERKQAEDRAEAETLKSFVAGLRGEMRGLTETMAAMAAKFEADSDSTIRHVRKAAEDGADPAYFGTGGIPSRRSRERDEAPVAPVAPVAEDQPEWTPHPRPTPVPVAKAPPPVALTPEEQAARDLSERRKAAANTNQTRQFQYELKQASWERRTPDQVASDKAAGKTAPIPNAGPYALVPVPGDPNPPPWKSPKYWQDFAKTA